jgi:hypothetical protein
VSQDLAIEAFLEFLNGCESGIMAARQRLKEAKPPKKETPSVVEQTFLCLKFEPQQGQRIGPYDVAYEPQNLPSNWTHAMNILKANNAVIEKRYRGPGYQYSYWLFGDHKIYRQKLK